jgi:PAS domain-containing protein
MASVHKREQSPGHVSESGIFELGGPLPGDERAARAGFDPLLEAFGEVRSLNTQLQGANDALHAVNETLRTRVEQLRITALDRAQMLDGLDVGIVLLDSDLVLLHFNVMAAHLLALQEADLGGSLHAACRGPGAQLAEWCREVLRSGQRIRRTFPSATGEPLSLQVRLTRVDGELRMILVFAEASEPR